MNNNIDRKTVIYGRVSTKSQKKDLQNQMQLLKQYCFNNGYQINAVYSDIASGIDFSNRVQFFNLLDQIISGKIKKVIITYKDRLSRIGFSFFEKFFKKYDCKIQVISQLNNHKLQSQQIFEQIISLIHCFSMKIYSKRKSNNTIIISTNSQDIK